MLKALRKPKKQGGGGRSEGAGAKRGGGKSRARGRGKQRASRIFFATDVHGSDVCFRKFLAAAKVYQADVLLLGGDFAGKGLVPVLRAGDGTLRAELDGNEVTVPAGDWDALTADINRRGFY